MWTSGSRKSATLTNDFNSIPVQTAEKYDTAPAILRYYCYYVLANRRHSRAGLQSGGRASVIHVTDRNGAESDESEQYDMVLKMTPPTNTPTANQSAAGMCSVRDR